MRHVSLSKIRKVPGMLILGILAIGFLVFPLTTLAACGGGGGNAATVKLTLRATLGMNDQGKCFNAPPNAKLASTMIQTWGTTLGAKATKGKKASTKTATSNNNQVAAVTKLVSAASCTWTMIKDGKNGTLGGGDEALLTSQDNQGNLTVYRAIKVGNQIFMVANKGSELKPLPANFKLINAA
jgi:hypothetical protein